MHRPAALAKCNRHQVRDHPEYLLVACRPKNHRQRQFRNAQFHRGNSSAVVRVPQNEAGAVHLHDESFLPEKKRLIENVVSKFAGTASIRAGRENAFVLEEPKRMPTRTMRSGKNDSEKRRRLRLKMRHLKKKSPSIRPPKNLILITHTNVLELQTTD